MKPLVSEVHFTALFKVPKLSSALDLATIAAKPASAVEPLLLEEVASLASCGLQPQEVVRQRVVHDRRFLRLMIQSIVDHSLRLNYSFNLYIYR